MVMADQTQVDKVTEQSVKLFQQNNPGKTLTADQLAAMRDSVQQTLSGSSPSTREAAAQARPLGGSQQPARELTTSERVGAAIDSYKKGHPDETFKAQEVKDLIDGVEATETRIGRKVTAEEIKTHAITQMVDDRKGINKVISVGKEAIIPAAYALDGGMNAQAGKAAGQAALSQGGKKVASALLGPIIGAGLVLTEAGVDLYQGHYKAAGINAASGLASIGAAAATGAALGTIVPGAGNVVGFIAGAAVGTAALLGAKWGLNKIFNDAATNETPAAAPVAVQNFVPQNNKKTAPVFGAATT